MFLQRTYHFPAADICFRPANTIHSRPSEREIRVLDRFGAASGDRRQHLCVEVGPMTLAGPVERVEQADMRRNERWCADDVPQPFAKFTQAGAVFDFDEDSTEWG